MEQASSSQAPTGDSGQQQVADLTRAAIDSFERVFGPGGAGQVFGAPVVAGDYTVITAAETLLVGGSGFGVGLGEPQAAEKPEATGGEQASDAAGGGGGGGFTMSRPVAAVVIGPDGVSVRPIVDVTKLGIAALTLAGSALFAVGRMRRAARLLGG